ncbi:MAG TPA: T9SS type A sorting domain-containing protein, partial [Bacteroidia bacterium]|nr:T9SS type A sorting domain-containing protein [Bacteroidia bacterium]
YAYDDGTAEAGYSITNAVNAKIAMRFDLLQADTVRAVQIFFVQQYDNSALNTFRLAIWSSLTPENLIYQRSSLLPIYTDSINGFATYAIPDTTLILQGTVYIGLICNLAKDYDLGFDFNTNNQNKMFFNSNGNWVNTTFQGSFMIRPIFGDSAIYAGVDDVAAKHQITLYPNPTNNSININSNLNFTQAVIYNTLGKQVVIIPVVEKTIHVESLNAGMYYVQFRTKEGIITRKFIKN